MHGRRASSDKGGRAIFLNTYQEGDKSWIRWRGCKRWQSTNFSFFPFFQFACIVPSSSSCRLHHLSGPAFLFRTYLAYDPALVGQPGRRQAARINLVPLHDGLHHRLVSLGVQLPSVAFRNPHVIGVTASTLAGLHFRGFHEAIPSHHIQVPPIVDGILSRTFGLGGGGGCFSARRTKGTPTCGRQSLFTRQIGHLCLYV